VGAAVFKGPTFKGMDIGHERKWDGRIMERRGKGERGEEGYANDLDLSKSYDVIDHVTIRFVICHFLYKWSIGSKPLYVQPFSRYSHSSIFGSRL